MKEIIAKFTTDEKSSANIMDLPSEDAGGESSEENQSTDEEDLLEYIPSPLESAVSLPLIKGEKQEYKNDKYFDEIMIIYKENPVEDPLSCYYVSASLMMFGTANCESIKFLRKKFAYLLNHQRLITAHEPELTMERLTMEATKGKEIPEKLFLNWESTALNGGSAYRMFNFILSYILNHPLYVLDLRTNQWREYNLAVANREQTQFHSEFVQECLLFDYMGPPFMHAEHMELGSNGEWLGTHVAAIIHESYYDSNDRLDHTYALSFERYLSFMKLPQMRSLYAFVFAGDTPESTAEREGNELVEENK